MPFRLQLTPAEALEHRAWRHARLAALDALERGEPVVLLGAAGTGKTLLLKALAQALGAMGWTTALLGADGALPGPGAELLLVDEAGTLSDDALAALAHDGRGFVLAAVPSFTARLSALPHGTVMVPLEPMARDDIARLVRVRQESSGRPRDLYSPGALAALARHSGGVIRLVLILAGAALFMAEQDEAAEITEAHVDEAALMRGMRAEPAPRAAPENGSTGTAPPDTMRSTPRPRLAAGAARRRAASWWRRLTIGMATTGLVMAACAALLATQLTPRRGPRQVMADARPPDAVAQPASPPGEPNPGEPTPGEPTPGEPTPGEPTPVEAAAVPEPQAAAMPDAPAAESRPPDPVPESAPRPARQRAAPAPPRPRAQPVPEATAVAPSPWWVDRSFAERREPRGDGRVVLREPANIRREPSLSAPVLRVTSPGMVLRVFARRGAWLQVGDSAPWGWVHSAVSDADPNGAGGNGAGGGN